MNPTCQHPAKVCPGTVIRDGHFRRAEDAKFVQRYRCTLCGHRFSAATLHPTYRQKKRRLNAPIARLLASTITLRRCALVLGINRKTVDRKLKFLGERCRRKNERVRAQLCRGVTEVQLDDLITKENSKLKPLSVSLLVDGTSRRILGAEVSRIPAFGHLAKLAVKKYGHRPDEHAEGLERLFAKVAPLLPPRVLVKSDEHQRYPPAIRRHLPRAQHATFKSERATVAGQGEMKKGGFDPLFVANHTCAMLRANLSRLIRRTWVTTKKVERLSDHLEIFIWYANHHLLKLPPTPI